jgi:hypothetical protein
MTRYTGGFWRALSLESPESFSYIRHQEAVCLNWMGCEFWMPPGRTSTELDSYGILSQRANSPHLEEQLTHSVGLCSNGPKCLFTHDVNRVAICKDYLQRGECFRGASCNLSHDPTPNRTPACIHFLRGNCTKPDCRYAHVKVDPAADVCREYATLGYCEKGATCTDRHESECPDYANTGSCPNKKCHLPHIDRAGQLRKIAGVQNIPSQPADSSSKSDSGKEDDRDDVDSDDLDEDSSMLPSASARRPSNATTMSSFSQQQDFIQF